MQNNPEKETTAYRSGSRESAELLQSAPGADVPDGSGSHADKTPVRVKPDNAQPAVNLVDEEDPDIPWRGLSAPPMATPLSAGVLQNDSAPKEQDDIFATAPGLFWPEEEWDENTHEGGCVNFELVLGVKLRQYGPVYFFRAGHEKIKSGGKVLVETEQGLSLAEVVNARRMRLPLPKIRTEEGGEIEIKPIKGLAGPEDIAASADNNILASGARLFCKECIRERRLDMKLVDVEVLHDRSKIIFYFTAPTRIDFRELVKDLVRNYRTRIELRQIGVRHETQMLGALGNCGMACCCRRYLRRFAPVTIKMAKEQNLFLNPAKLSGICGRLLCCLANEQENYEEFHKNSPKLGKRYQTSEGNMKILRANLFRQSIVAAAETGEEREFQLDEWRAIAPVRLESKPEPGLYQPEHKNQEQSYLPDGAFGMEEADSAALEGLLDKDGEIQGQGRGHKTRAHEGNSAQPGSRNPANRGVRSVMPQQREERGRGAAPQKQADGQDRATHATRDGNDTSVFGLPGSRYKK